MKYGIFINQVGIVRSGLDKETDVVDWMIIDYLRDWYFAERKKRILIESENCYYVWVNYNHLISEMPLLGITCKNALSLRLKKLKKLDLIKTIQEKDNTLYFNLTEFCISTYFYKETTMAESAKKQTPYPLQSGHPIHSKVDTLSTPKWTAQTVYPNSILDNNNISLECEKNVEDEEVNRMVDNKDDKKELEIIASFNSFYDIYPRKEDKKRALRTYTSRIKEKIKPEQILIHTARYAEQCKIDDLSRLYIKLPATFLNAVDFRDKPPDLHQIIDKNKKQQEEKQEDGKYCEY